MADEWIWISRWEDFQHYPVERDRAPAWIKAYNKQLDDWRYLQLSNRQRALLADLRHIFSTTHAQLKHDASMIGARRHAETRHADLEALNHAGLIQFISRATLESRLEQLYASRAPARSRREGSKEPSKNALARELAGAARASADRQPPPAATSSWQCPECGAQLPTEDVLYTHIVTCNGETEF
jgi:hypothetical protein